MASTINELILNSEIIKKIKNEPGNLWQHLATETPEEWTLDGVSELTGESYKYLPIDTLEFLMELIFFRNFQDEISFQSVSVNGNSATVSIAVEITFQERSVQKIVHSKSGTATITVMDNFYFDKSGAMKFYEKSKKPIRAAQLLRTATPLCLTEARKNAIKNICNLFGRNLNREVLESVPHETENEIKKEKVKADIIIMRQYERAINIKDERTIKEIESRYDIKTN